MTLFVILSMIAFLPGQGHPDAPGRQASKPAPEERALAYLGREVPKWSAANKCYSCHNNGDAARALYTAVRLSFTIPAQSLDDTSRWLSNPERWDHNGGEGPFKDKKLARIQFAAALADAVDAGLVKDRQALTRAAQQVANDQQKDGSSQADTSEDLGTPATYGTCLATAIARRTLQKTDSLQFRSAIAKADQWLRQEKVRSVLDAAAVLLGLEGNRSDGALAQRQHCLDVIRKGQGKDGGWGPYGNSPPEAFDTAVVLLALSQHAESPEIRQMIQRGRAFLIAEQLDDGHWTETTRPPGATSYAQRLSTTGWATLALLVTRSGMKVP